ncbi:transcription activator GLK1 isoform X2 [Punica granatum]|uniref:Transcription activator GLK1 isoform X2 n=1 Tax=Punica granatum TaxID=22663 RepID=A0A6P8C580_PUNGR|nr:transcription activator GLK1 isoform X2 [Punica granatum]
MLALSPPRSREDGKDTLDFPAGSADHHQFIDFGDGNLLDCIDFDDLFTDIEVDGAEFLPDLEMVDPDNIGEFSPTSGGEESEVMNVSEVLDRTENGASVNDENEEEDKSASERDEPGKVDQSTAKGTDKGGRRVGRKSSSSVQSKNNPPQGKRKVKVDWTPELHRKFVQAVEQLGLDKAVPSKILEIMGMDCLTRHNIASHLQKYRSHRKHLLAREVEAASWSRQGRMMYGGGKMEPSPLLISGPTMGFPPPVIPLPVQPQFRPLHVWGHPTADQAWPKHPVHQLPAALPSTPAWPAVGPPYSPIPPLAPPMGPSAYWHPHHHQVLNTCTAGTPYLPQPRAFTGLMTAPPVSGIPPKAMYKEDPGIGVPSGQSGPQPPPDFHPSGETIDAAIGDALKKPWQPLPLGLKPPSLDGVLTELHREGIPDIPPSSPS